LPPDSRGGPARSPARAPRERPPAGDDALFLSAAAYGPGVLGVVLSGVLDDGVAGLAAIKARGGHTLVQDPAEAIYTGMPTRAIATVQPERVLPAHELGRELVRLAAEPPTARAFTFEEAS
jgi:two-component system chemotaxis response regulator CheB